MARSWSFLSHNGLVMLAVARQPDLRLREIAEIVGISPRATQTIVSDLAEAGFIVRSRVGRRNHYQVRGDRALPHPAAADHDVSELVGALISGPRVVRRRPGTGRPLVLACSDHRFQEPLRDLLAAQALLGRAEVVLWPGGAAALTGAEGRLLLGVMEDAATGGRPSRILLVAHEDCHVWTAFDRAGDDFFANLRAIWRRRSRTASAVAGSLGVIPETWYLTVSGAHPIGSSGHRQPVRLSTTASKGVAS
ncbi:MAG: helix-turn-helix transcriptional regulator [Actinomycetota bacterium]